jgi:acyl carrier protein|tara:strand:- start:477 stop:719 length:243 start_codon:yes stop_codon:yes gene_type:complete
LDNKKKYEKVFMDSFSISKDKLKKDLKYNTIPQWDSVGHMSMIAALEDAFNITFEMDDIIDFSSYKTGKEILKKYKVNIS